MNNKVILESLAMDLMRVALGYQRGSNKMAEHFVEEALKRKNEVDYSLVKPYIKKILINLESKLRKNDTIQVAEDSLVISTLFQNYTRIFQN